MKAKQEAKERFPELEFDFTFHDLKAKGVSDLEGNLYDRRDNWPQECGTDREVCEEDCSSAYRWRAVEGLQIL